MAFAGAGAAGTAGALLAGAGWLPSCLMTDDFGRAWMSEIVTARTENATNDQVVTFSRTVVAPRAPKVVCEDEAPKALATSAPFPCWRRTTRIRKTQTMT